MNIPDRGQCFQMMHRMDMMEHIAAHSIMVAAVALFLTDEYAQTGTILNRKLIDAAALLHDITKTRSIVSGEMHAETGESYLVKEGFPEVGSIVGQHVALKCYRVSAKVTEAEIVNYADKRVLHDKIVSLKHRMEYILDRYGKIPQRREKLLRIGEQTEILEEKLFLDLSLSPEDVASKLPENVLEPDLEEYRRSSQCESRRVMPHR